MAQATVQRLHGSGLEALELLESQEFDIVLVSSYLPDLYVGDFFERFNRLPVRPCVIVKQEGQAVKSMDWRRARFGRIKFDAFPCKYQAEASPNLKVQHNGKHRELLLRLAVHIQETGGRGRGFRLP
jgi:hypothetical protein